MKGITHEELENSSYTLDIVEDILKADKDAIVYLDMSDIADYDAFGFLVKSSIVTHDMINSFMDKYVSPELIASDYCPIPAVVTDLNSVNDLDYYRKVVI